MKERRNLAAYINSTHIKWENHMGKQDTAKWWFENIWFRKCLSWRWWEITPGAGRSTSARLFCSVLGVCCWQSPSQEDLRLRTAIPALLHPCPARPTNRIPCTSPTTTSISSIYSHWNQLKLLELLSCLAILTCVTTSLWKWWNWKHDYTWNKLLVEGKSFGVHQEKHECQPWHALPKWSITSVISCVKPRHENDTVVWSSWAGFVLWDPEVLSSSWGSAVLGCIPAPHRAEAWPHTTFSSFTLFLGTGFLSKGS